MKALFLRPDGSQRPGFVPEPPPRDYFIPLPKDEIAVVSPDANGKTPSPRAGGMEHMRFVEFIAVYALVQPTMKIDPKGPAKNHGG